ncbi:MAG TPA: phenylacetate--CoA ligase, partial [Desulfobacterales bacterium]|nr:phenylacetate--CoA ligase [Desulfobacterales bacterium]
LDHLTVRVEAKQEIYDAGPDKEAEVEKKISGHLKGMLGISVRVRLVEPKLIERSEGKAKRIIDERPKE